MKNVTIGGPFPVESENKEKRVGFGELIITMVLEPAKWAWRNIWYLGYLLVASLVLLLPLLLDFYWR